MLWNELSSKLCTVGSICFSRMSDFIIIPNLAAK